MASRFAVTVIVIHWNHIQEGDGNFDEEQDKIAVIPQDNVLEEYVIDVSELSWCRDKGLIKESLYKYKEFPSYWYWFGTAH